MAETRKGSEEKKTKLQAAKKEFTRAKATEALACGADFNDAKFTLHRNSHVRQYAWKLGGGVVPEGKAERQALWERLAKGRTAAAKAGLEVLLGLAEPVKET